MRREISFSLSPCEEVAVGLFSPVGCLLAESFLGPSWLFEGDLFPSEEVAALLVLDVATLGGAVEGSVVLASAILSLYHLSYARLQLVHATVCLTLTLLWHIHVAKVS